MTSIIVTATPGTGALFTIAAGLARGVKAGMVAAIGCTLGIVPHMVVALSGAAALLTHSPVAFNAVKWLGVIYLLYMAWGTWRQTGVFAPEEEGKPTPSMGKTIGSAILVNLLNPKLTLFFFVFLPLFVDPSAEGALGQMLILGAAFMAVTLAIFAVYGYCAAWLRKYVVGKPTVMRWIGRVFAITFVALAIMLAFTSQGQ
nr:LysE family translocator [Kocuria indica]